MDAQEYCELIEQKARNHKKFYLSIPIKEDNSPLISLKESGFNLIYEPSIKKDYKYLVREAVFEKIGNISRLLDKDDKILTRIDTVSKLIAQLMLLFRLVFVVVCYLSLVCCRRTCSQRRFLPARNQPPMMCARP